MPATSSRRASAPKNSARLAADSTAGAPAKKKSGAKRGAADGRSASDTAADGGKKTKRDKPKLVRDSFTMPKTDYALIDQLKQRGMALGRETKKSELLRAGLHALAAMPDRGLKEALGTLIPIKVGRPKTKK